MALNAQNIDCRRGDRLVLAGVTFSLNAGDCLILRGPNGVGKSTLLRVLAGLAPAARGVVDVDPDQIAYAGHLDGVKAQLSVVENLAFWAGVYGTDMGITLAHFGLEALADRFAHTLSAGQKRRLGLARLHLSGRDVWILDEPTTSLDAAHVALFEQAFVDHCAQGGIAIISTHLDLKIPGSKTLDLAQFKPSGVVEANPFLTDFN